MYANKTTVIGIDYQLTLFINYEYNNLNVTRSKVYLKLILEFLFS